MITGFKVRGGIRETGILQYYLLFMEVAKNDNYSRISEMLCVLMIAQAIN